MGKAKNNNFEENQSLEQFAEFADNFDNINELLNFLTEFRNVGPKERKAGIVAFVFALILTKLGIDELI